jgi:hypothetical protein
MDISSSHHRLELPDSLRSQLLDFRRRVWTIKMIEAACGAATGVLIAFLATFVLDRVWDTPAGIRLAIFAAAMLVCAVVPLALHRWIWRQRRLEQLARLLSRKNSHIGDELLGVIELVRSETEQARSLALCEAAIGQVASEAKRYDFRDSVPNPRHRRRAVLAATAAAVAIALLVLYPAATVNSWARFLMPWKDTPRYTFTTVEFLPDRLVVAHGEPFTVTVTLTEQTVWRPEQATVRLGNQPPVTAALRDGRYEFELPAQIDASRLGIRVGDLSKKIRVEPTLRPELTSVVASVALPEYLRRPEPQHKDVRGGGISLVNGSRTTFVATASRELAAADIDGEPSEPAGPRIASPAATVDGLRKMQFEWRDRFGLAGKEPFTLSITGRDDEAPSLACDDLPRQRVVLDSELLSFKVKAIDDFGIKRVGLEWQGIDKTTVKNPAQGERILAAGGTDKDSLELAGTFSAQALGIEPQPIHVRLFAEDYFPDRERVYSPTYLFYVLDAEQHAIWLTEMLSKWHRQSLEVRDREMQLYETNKQLRALSADELNEADTRRRIENQATAERANARRLSNLVATGEELVRQATRNPEFGVGHLEKWAAMLQILKDISANRMPSVADLLKQASQSPAVAMNSPTKPSPTAGQVRASATGSGSNDSDAEKKNTPAVPRIADVESSQQPPGKKSESQSPPSDSQAAPRLGLPVTTLIGSGGKDDNSCPAGQKIEEAVIAQQDLLAEFDKIADELNRVLANLEGSTLVKRLKAASRLQDRIAVKIGDQVSDAFGVPGGSTKAAQRQLFAELAGQETKGSQDVSTIMDDMQSYFERRRFVQMKTVLDDMRKQDVIGGLRQLSDDLSKENGVSMAQCEFWSDTLDRWAEDLVDSTKGGT